MINKKTLPSIDEWLKEAKADPNAPNIGMFLVHNGVVRQTPKAKVRQGLDDGSLVKGMEFSYDAVKVCYVVCRVGTKQPLLIQGSTGFR